MEIIEKEIGELTAYENNSRTHSDEQIQQIIASINEFGFTNPVLVDAENGIIAGHGRVMAAQKLGLEKVPCIRLAHLTETQKRAYIIADNKLALNAGWDEEMLGLELADLREADFDLGLLGFDESELGSFDVEEGDMPELSSDDKQPFQQMTFTVHDEQAEDVQAAMSKAKQIRLLRNAECRQLALKMRVRLR